ncbi:MAG: ABC transporter permease [Thiotrichales bacterium]
MTFQSLLRLGWRDLRLMPIRLWLLAVMLAMASLTAVNVFSARLVEGIERQASTLLGADLVVESPRVPALDYEHIAAELNVAAAGVVLFSSVVLHGESTLLVQVKAVSERYPLRGSLEIRSAMDVAPRPTESGPARGEAWVDAAVLQRTGLAIGDRILLGRSEFLLARIVDFEPDGGVDVLQFAPRVMVALADLPATDLVGPASRVNYRLMFAGAPDSIRTLRARIESRLTAAEKLVVPSEARKELSAPLDNIQKYLGLAGLLTAAFAGVAMFLAMRLFVREQVVAAAVLRALGSRRSQLLARFGTQVLGYGLVAGAVGGVIGLGIQVLLANWVTSVADFPLAPPQARPVLLSLAWIAVLLALFSGPQVWKLINTPPARALRDEHLSAEPRTLWWVALAFPLLAVLVVIQTGNPRLSLVGVLVLSALLLLQWAAAAGLIGALRHAPEHGRWRWLTHQPRRGLVLAITLGSVLTLGLVLTQVKDQLLLAWEQQIPVDAPNHFLINIQPDEEAGVAALLRDEGMTSVALYPMARGRLIEHNGRPIVPEQFDHPRAQRLVDREFNLSAARVLPDDNRIVAGEWFATDQAEGLSVEQGIAKTLGLALGDTLTFDVGGTLITESIMSLRTVRWESVRPNFFVFLTQQRLEQLPRTAITSLHISSERSGLIARMVQAFPSVTVLDVRAILQQVRRVLDLASQVLILVFTLVLGVALSVLLTLLLAQREERTREIALLKALGATARQLRQRLWLEFLTIGMVAGAVAGLVAELATTLLIRQLFGMDYPIQWATLAIGIAGAWILLGLGSVLMLQGLLRVSPPALFRKG